MKIYLRKFRKCYINTDSDSRVVVCDQLHKAQSFLRTGPQLVKKFSAFYETPKYITAFRNAHRLSPFRGITIQPITLHLACWISILILSPSTSKSTKWSPCAQAHIKLQIIRKTYSYVHTNMSFSRRHFALTWHFKYYLEMALRYCLQGVPYFTVWLFSKKKTRIVFGLTGVFSSSSYPLWYRLGNTQTAVK